MYSYFVYYGRCILSICLFSPTVLERHFIFFKGLIPSQSDCHFFSPSLVIYWTLKTNKVFTLYENVKNFKMRVCESFSPSAHKGVRKFFSFKLTLTPFLCDPMPKRVWKIPFRLLSKGPLNFRKVYDRNKKCQVSKQLLISWNSPDTRCWKT